MRIDVFTIFPATGRRVRSARACSGEARDEGLLDVRVHDLRSATTDPHRTVDDAPFGGGAGMVLMPEPLFAAVEAVEPPRPLFLLGPGGRAVRPGAWPASSPRRDGLLAAVRPLRGRRRAGARPPRRRRAVGRRLRAGRRRGGGAGRDRGGRPARARRDGQRRRRRPTSRSPTGCSSTRSTPGRPSSAAGTVPEVLRSGDHARIARWRRAQALRRTIARRPDLIAARGGSSDEDAACSWRSSGLLPLS